MIWKIVYMTFNITSLMNITNIFGNWLNGVDKKKAKPTLELEFVLCYGRYGMCAMIASLTKQNFHHFCRLFQWLPIGSICGPICAQRRSALLWILGATDWQRLHGISTASTVGVLIED
jgi:hypothetical protein